MNINLTEMTNDDFDALRVRVLTEKERRANLSRIPDQIADLSRTYRDGGGDPSKLTAAITEE